MGYDKIIKKQADGEVIVYGVIHGNNKIVFIKVGADGSINGYKDKYITMSNRIHERLGATVICASNPFISDPVVTDKEMLLSIIEETGISEFELYLFGTSDGAYHNLRLAKEFPESVNVLCVNTPFFDSADIQERIFDLPHVNKIFVFGSEDDDCLFVPNLKELKDQKLDVITVEGADHEFKGKLEEYIDLIDLL